jgi:type VI secretion system protein ImpF
MFAFREAYDKKDATKVEDIRVNGERVVADRASISRRGTEEFLLKQDLDIDLSALVDTINFGSTVDISEHEYVRKSVLNYGVDDITHMTLGSDTTKLLVERLKDALLHHEPRLSPDTLIVDEAEKRDDDVNQRIRFRIRADLVCKPLDIPVEFVAELDQASGKVTVPRLTGAA